MFEPTPLQLATPTPASSLPQLPLALLFLASLFMLLFWIDIHASLRDQLSFAAAQPPPSLLAAVFSRYQPLHSDNLEPALQLGSLTP